MTIVIANRLLNSIIIVADCRVSYTGSNVVDDNLQKIYQLNKRMVLGFSGPLSGAYQVLDKIKSNISNYSKPPIADNLRIDVERWIRHEYREIENEQDRLNLSFVIATVEPRREVHSKFITSGGKEAPKPKWFPYMPDLCITTLKPSKAITGGLQKTNLGMCHVIGVNKEAQKLARDTVVKLFGFEFGKPGLQAQAIVNSLMAVLMEKHILTVGGLFQCALLSSNGINWMTYDLPSDYGDVSLDIIDGKYIQRNNVTGRIVPLETIWGWWQKWRLLHKPGSSGPFEDPYMRKVFTNNSDNK